MALAPEIGHPSVRSTESGWLYNQGREMQLVHTQMQGRPRKPQEVLPGKEAGGEREGEAQGKRISYFLRRLTLVPEEQGSTFHVLPALACAATLSPPRIPAWLPLASVMYLSRHVLGQAIPEPSA